MLGAAHDTVDWDAQNECQVRIQADGPFGPIEPVEFVIIKVSRAAPLGTTSGRTTGHSSSVRGLTERGIGGHERQPLLG